MKHVVMYVGFDAHKKDLFIAMLLGDAKSPVTWTVPNEPNAVRRLVRRLEREAPGPVQACYEAGPCGYVLQRQLTTLKVSCQVSRPPSCRANQASASRRIVAMLANWRSCCARAY